MGVYECYEATEIPGARDLPRSNVANAEAKYSNVVDRQRFNESMNERKM